MHNYARERLREQLNNLGLWGVGEAQGNAWQVMHYVPQQLNAHVANQALGAAGVALANVPWNRLGQAFYDQWAGPREYHNRVQREVSSYQSGKGSTTRDKLRKKRGSNAKRQRLYSFTAKPPRFRRSKA